MLNQSLFSDSLIEQEIKLEHSAIDAGVKRYRLLARQAIDRGDGAALRPAQRLMLHWYLPLLSDIRSESRQIRKGEPSKGRAVYGGYWLMLPPDRIAVLTMHEIISALMKNPQGLKVAHIAYSIGRAFFAEVNLQLLKKQKEERDFPDDSGRKYTVNLAEELQKQCTNFTPYKINWWAKKSLDDPIWERKASAHIGCRLIWSLLSVASLNEYTEEATFVPAFHHVHRRQGKIRPAFLVMDDRAYNIIEEGHSARQAMRPKYLPMIVPPYKWSEDSEGGYVSIRTPFISKPKPLQKDALKAADLSQVHDCLDAVSATPWRVNGNIYDVIRKLWDEGGNACGVPRLNNIPMPPEAMNFDDPEIKKKWKSEAYKIHMLNRQLKADRFNFIQKLNIAKEYLARDRFYFPHQLDFRGRVYPIPVGLNHQGDDVCRGLLEFADTKPVTHAGIRWLKIHAANLYGADKCSFDDRVRWADGHMGMILASAEDPMSCDFWQHADESERDARDGKPWQFLAACIALADPDGAGQHLPCQIDGTCNGLQHYAAMGRDAVGAKHVNLIPSDTPQDIYGYVAERLRPIVALDADKGMMEAQIIADGITRKLIKQTVMTKVYNVSPVGARKQIFDKLDKSGLKDDPRYKVSMYLSNKTLDTVAKVCVSADAIMEWMKQCARLITTDKGKGEAKVKGVTVSWNTPLGFPVVQPYRKYYQKRILTVLQKLYLLVNDETVDVATGRQVDGVAPNFVHSIDSTHMFMTARTCRNEGIAFASVHDSYWCHASNMDRMGVILRDEFINLHHRDLLGELRAQWQALRPDVDLPPCPPMGDLDLSLVADAIYAFN